MSGSSHGAPSFGLDLAGYQLDDMSRPVEGQLEFRDKLHDIRDMQVEYSMQAHEARYSVDKEAIAAAEKNLSPMQRDLEIPAGQSWPEQRPSPVDRADRAAAEHEQREALRLDVRDKTSSLAASRSGSENGGAFSEREHDGRLISPTFPSSHVSPARSVGTVGTAHTFDSLGTGIFDEANDVMRRLQVRETYPLELIDSLMDLPSPPAKAPGQHARTVPHEDRKVHEQEAYEGLHLEAWPDPYAGQPSQSQQAPVNETSYPHDFGRDQPARDSAAAALAAATAEQGSFAAMLGVGLSGSNELGNRERAIWQQAVSGLGGSIDNDSDRDGGVSHRSHTRERGRGGRGRDDDDTCFDDYDGDRSTTYYPHAQTATVPAQSRGKLHRRVRFQDDRVRSLLLSAESLRRLGYTALSHKETFCDSQPAASTIKRPEAMSTVLVGISFENEPERALWRMCGGVALAYSSWEDVRDETAVAGITDCRWTFDSSANAACFYERMMAFSKSKRGSVILAGGSQKTPAALSMGHVGDLCTAAARSNSMAYLFLVGTVVSRVVVKRGSMSAHVLIPMDAQEIAEEIVIQIRALTDAQPLKVPATVFAEACNYDPSVWDAIAARAGIIVPDAQRLLLGLSRRNRQSVKQLVEILAQPARTESLDMPHVFGTLLEEDLMDEWLFAHLHNLMPDRYRGLELWQLYELRLKRFARRSHEDILVSLVHEDHLATLEATGAPRHRRFSDNAAANDDEARSLSRRSRDGTPGRTGSLSHSRRKEEPEAGDENIKPSQCRPAYHHYPEMNKPEMQKTSSASSTRLRSISRSRSTRKSKGGSSKPIWKAHHNPRAGRAAPSTNSQKETMSVQAGKLYATRHRPSSSNAVGGRW